MQRKSLFNALSVLLYIPFVIALTILAFRHPEISMLSGAFSCISLVILLAIVFLPIGRLSLGQDAPSPLIWFLKVVSFQTILVLIFLAGLLAFFKDGPIFSRIFLEPHTLELAAIKHQWLIWSFLPWSLLIIWVILSGYYYYIRKLGPYPHQVMSETFSSFYPSRAKSLVETTFYSINTLCLAMLMTVSISLSAKMIQDFLQWPSHTSLSPVTFTIVGFIMAFFVWHFRRKRMIALEKKGVRLASFAVMIFVILTLSLVVSSFAIQSIIAASGLSLDSLQCSNCARFFDTTTTENRLAAYYWGWGLMLIPLAGSYLVKISKGRRLREVVIGLSFFPLIIIGLVTMQFDFILDVLRDSAIFGEAMPLTLKTPLFVGGAMISLGFVIFFTKGVHNSHVFNAGVLENLKTCQAGRTSLEQGVKLLGFSRICLPFFVAVQTVLFMHMIGGWYLIQMNLVLFAPLTMYNLYCAMLIIFIQFKRKGLWLRPDRVVGN